MTQPPTIDYRPAKQVTYKPAYSIEAAIVVGVPALAFAISSFVALPWGIEQIFKDFRLMLPAITRYWFSSSRWFLLDFGWIYTLALVIAIPFIWGRLVTPLQDPMQRKVRRLTLLVMMQLVVMLFGFVVALAVYAPLVSLMRAVSGPRK